MLFRRGVGRDAVRSGTLPTATRLGLPLVDPVGAMRGIAVLGSLRNEANSRSHTLPAMQNHKEILRIVASMDQPSRDRFVRTIRTYKNECGCKLGGIFALFAMIACIPYSLLSFTAISVFAGLTTLLWSALVIVAAGLVGKGIGIGVARVKLMALYRNTLRIHH